MVDEVKSKSDIILEEKIAKIDDINFDKIYDVNEFATKQIQDLNHDEEDDLSIEDIVNANDFSVSEKEESLFEMEVQPNEFLDNLVFKEENEEDEEFSLNDRKLKISNKPLFFTFTSIAVLLCILFIYNVFVINSLQSTYANSSPEISPASVSANIDEENNYILFDNFSKIEINKYQNYDESQITNNNWFETVCSYIGQLFGGSY